MSLIVIPLFHTGSQFPFNPLCSSTVSCAGALQSLLLRHHCLFPAARPNQTLTETNTEALNTCPVSLAVVSSKITVTSRCLHTSGIEIECLVRLKLDFPKISPFV